MRRIKLLRRLRKFHKWPSIVISVFVILFALSGIVLNHRGLFSALDVPRNYLPQEYRYHNWNNAAVRSACKLSPDALLIYGNIGIWLTDSNFSDFTDMNHGLPQGIDGRKVFKVHRTTNGNLYAGTLFGLYRYDGERRRWAAVHAAFNDHEVVDILDKDDSLFVMTRSFIFASADKAGSLEFTRQMLPPPHNYDNKEGLFKTLWVIHSGEIGGLAGQIFVDLLGLAFIFLTLTGILYWLFPKWIRKRKQSGKAYSSILSLKRFSLKWHNKVGLWLVLFLLITTTSGMFLRPPLLIAIATAKVDKIPYTMLDQENAWYDKLRRLHYDEGSGRYLVGTNQGFYSCDEGFNSPLHPIPGQPPISVMGINVFEELRKDTYLVGSFTGLYLWQPGEGITLNVFDPARPVVNNTNASPIGEHMTAGLVNLGKGRIFHFDYNSGVVPIGNSPSFPPMPDNIIESSPMSLWNLALEFHTARIYSVFLGDFYILFIPLFGLTMLIVLVTGLWLYLKIYFKRRR